MRGRLLLWSPLILLGFVSFVALGGYVVRQLWNWLLPPLFGWHGITFWQALGLLALCRILFGGLGLHSSPGSRMRRRMADRWATLSPEERERLRQRWGCDPAPGERRGAEPPSP